MRSEPLRLRDIRATTPFRLSLLLGSLFLAGILATLVLSYLLTARELTARSDRLLFARAVTLLAAPAAALPQRIDAEVATAAPGFSYFALRAADGEWVAGNIRIVGPFVAGRPFSIPDRPGAHAPLRLLAVHTTHGETIVLGRDISQIRDLRHRLMLILLVSGLGSALTVLALAVLLSLAPLRRVRDLREASRAIAAGDLTRRMPIAGREDELDQFAGTVNLMVEEVAHVVAQVKIATDAIAHDLRTPLTRVRTQLYRLRQLDGPTAEHAALVDRAVADLDAVIQRFAALLRIAELEASERRSGLAPLDIAPLLAELVELYEPLAEARGAELTLMPAPSFQIEADRSLLFEAIGNLIDNSTKFGATRIEVAVRRDDAGPLIEVSDDGIGIPEDERAAVVRRFHRARGASGVEGTGLGLAVVSAIMHLHGFVLELADARPGLIARIRFVPAAPR